MGTDEEYLSCFQVLAITNNAVMNIIEQMSLLYECASFGYMPKSGIAGSCARKLLSFRRSHLLIVDLSVYATVVMFRKQSPVPISSRVLPTFSSNGFSVAGFMLRSLIHLELSFVHGDRYGSICSLLLASIQLCQQHLLKDYSSIIELEVRDHDSSGSSFIV
ncbi:Protein of unknown function DUF3704 containing protein [Cricetulus griseus]|nr:Protein of unknown function DUF3704 containing protein [Cricetulus griseus]